MSNRYLLSSCALVGTTIALCTSIDSAQADPSGCSASTRLLRYACGLDVRDGFFVAAAQCADNARPEGACFDEARESRNEGLEECRDVFEARLELCEATGDAAHEPAFGEAFAGNFVDPREIGAGVTPNPYFPLVEGNRWVYEGDGETITVVVTDKTKLIDGVSCVVVNDLVTEDGVQVEDTDDWYAQDLDGNVWYCGEIAENFEVFEGDDPEEAELVDIDGSWKHGRDGAEAGMLLPFAPQPGEIIRQEVLFGEAEDVVEILSLTETESAPGGSCTGDCLLTRDFTPLEPGAEENKYYAPGIGLILEVKPETGERVELVEFANP